MLSTTIAATIGWQVALDERVAGAILVGFVAFTIVMVKWTWVPAIFALGLVALNDEGITPLKLLFFLGIFMLSVTAASWLLIHPPQQINQIMSPLVWSSLVLGVLLVISLMVAYANGTGLSTWARSSTPYVLFCLIPFIAVAIYRYTKRSALEHLFVVTSSIGALTYVIEWAENRKVLDTNIGGVVYGSGGSFFALYYYALAKVSLRQAGFKWLIILAFLIVGIILTGSRTAYVHLLGLVIVPLLARRDMVGVLGQAAIRFVAVGVVISVVGAGLIRGGVIDPEPLRARFDLVGTVFTSGSSDSSRDFRAQSTRVSWLIVRDHPVFGVGPGYNIQEYWRASGAPQVSIGGVFQVPRQIIDSPLAFSAAFGAIGTFVALLVAACYTRFLRVGKRSERDTAGRMAIQAWSIVLLLMLPVAFPLEERSLAFGLAFLIALSLPGNPNCGEGPAQHRLGSLAKAP